MVRFSYVCHRVENVGRDQRVSRTMRKKYFVDSTICGATAKEKSPEGLSEKVVKQKTD
jgi:hypothetical protein